MFLKNLFLNLCHLDFFFFLTKSVSVKCWNQLLEEHVLSNSDGPKPRWMLRSVTGRTSGGKRAKTNMWIYNCPIGSRDSLPDQSAKPSVNQQGGVGGRWFDVMPHEEVAEEKQRFQQNKDKSTNLVLQYSLDHFFSRLYKVFLSCVFYIDCGV